MYMHGGPIDRSVLTLPVILNCITSCLLPLTVISNVMKDLIDLYHTAAILSPRTTKSFVFARLALH